MPIDETATTSPAFPPGAAGDVSEHDCVYNAALSWAVPGTKNGLKEQNTREAWQAGGVPASPPDLAGRNLRMEITSGDERRSRP